MNPAWTPHASGAATATPGAPVSSPREILLSKHLYINDDNDNQLELVKGTALATATAIVLVISTAAVVSEIAVGRSRVFA